MAEKYQTGFDQPLLTTMYVDKPLIPWHAWVYCRTGHRASIAASLLDAFGLAVSRQDPAQIPA